MQGYPCLAEIAGRQGNWQEVLTESNRALDLDRSTDSAAYVYQGATNFSLQRFPEAERSALQAQDIEAKKKEADRDARIHLLLAQIYEQENEPAKKPDQLRQFLKTLHDPQAQAAVQQLLAQLEPQGTNTKK
jgi:tetratricopeptide (TPR) repeat protein